jgi:hypothetical protein
MMMMMMMIIPVLIGVTGTISKSFRKFLSNVPGGLGIKEVQMTS